MAKKSYHKVGDWRKVTASTKMLKREMEIARMMSLKRFGLKAEAIAKGHISRQDLGWAPLDPKYLAKKIKKGLSNNILIATSSYFQSITSYVILDTAYIGVKKQIRHDDGSFIADIAKLHEYGSDTAGIPARPLWKPTLNEVLIWHVKKNLPARYFKINMRKYGYR